MQVGSIDALFGISMLHLLSSVSSPILPSLLALIRRQTHRHGTLCMRTSCVCAHPTAGSFCSAYIQRRPLWHRWRVTEVSTLLG
ncbi:hypothetical protein BJV78DRAFT_1181229 [Lactifluus subvellereus]|nr:hypothetical protein BJV78DRAFT_1181229 [Lactifluus subvellereus]